MSLNRLFFYLPLVISWSILPWIHPSSSICLSLFFKQVCPSVYHRVLYSTQNKDIKFAEARQTRTTTFKLCDKKKSFQGNVRHKSMGSTSYPLVPWSIHTPCWIKIQRCQRKDVHDLHNLQTTRKKESLRGLFAWKVWKQDRRAQFGVYIQVTESESNVDRGQGYVITCPRGMWLKTGKQDSGV